MIINFSKNIKLYSWANGSSGQSCRRVYQTLNTEYKIGVVIRPYNFEQDKYLVRFQWQLKFLEKYFPDFYPYLLKGNLEYVKNEVDSFLIAMSKLNAFS